MKICGICDKAAMYTVERPMGIHVCEECVGFAKAIGSYEHRRHCFSGRAVTLDGKDARIIGLRNDSATVAAVDTASGPAHEWSWLEVARVVSHGGRFRS